MPHILTTLRDQHGYTQEKLAKAIGVSRQHLAKVEAGEADIKLAQARTCAELFGISVDALSLGELPAADDVLLKKTPKKTAVPQERDPRPQITVKPENVEKFKEVLLYVLGKVGALPNVGRTVLFKLLYFIDFDYYEKYEEQLMGVSYRKESYGPFPVEFAAIVAQMKTDGALQEIRGTYFDHEQIKYLPLRKPNLTAFRSNETQLIDEVMAKYATKSATEISDIAHRDVPWKVHAMHEVIDYESVFYRDAAFSVREDDDEL
ncbi:MAG: type II toxin-antitoxin system antitoxin SocA domain-containing protein [Candidatus Peregrinibacteria bacterium]